MNGSATILELLRSWHLNYGKYSDLIDEEVFDDANGGVVKSELKQVEKACYITVTNTGLPLRKLRHDYRQHVSNIDEILSYFKDSEFETMVQGSLG